jgi:hypothetical protein
MKWQLNDRWEGRNFEVRLDPVNPEIAPLPETAMAHASS